MKIKAILGTAVCAVIMAGGGSAATMTKQFDATSAVGNGSDHSLWFKLGIGGAAYTDFDFDPAGTLTLFDDDTMTLVGSTTSQNIPEIGGVAAGFEIDFSYNNVFTNSGGAFTPEFKSENGSVEVLGQTFFRNMTGGTLTGTGILDGLVLTVERLPEEGPEATQIGPSDGVNEGANNKNTNYGMANWFKITGITDACTSTFCDSVTDDFAYLDGSQGDINIDLAPVPLPAGLLLLLTGIGGLAAVRRTKG